MINKIEEIVKEIEQNTDKSEAYFQILHDENEYGTELEGNYQDIRLFAAELLQKSLEIENGSILSHSMLDDKILVGDSKISITSFANTREQIQSEQKIPSASNKITLGGIGCIIALLFLVTLFIFGIIYFINLF